MTRKTRSAKVPKVRVKVSKETFDRVLGKLIQTKPIKRDEKKA